MVPPYLPTSNLISLLADSIFAPGPLNFPVNGQPVILGPDGTPVYQSAPGNPPAPIALYPPPPQLDDGIPNFDYSGPYGADVDELDQVHL